MFTGIIEQVGRVKHARRNNSGMVLSIEAAFDPLPKLGDSIAVDGACLTVTVVDSTGFSVDVSHETLAKTTLSNTKVGAMVNLERAAKLGASMDGHLVYGHVDGVIEVMAVESRGENRVIRFALPSNLARFVAQKGSVAINGVSLTTNTVTDTWFDLNIVPFTLKHTNLGQLVPGSRVNVEVDVIARYLDRMMQWSKRPGLAELLQKGDW